MYQKYKRKEKCAQWIKQVHFQFRFKHFARESEREQKRAFTKLLIQPFILQIFTPSIGCEKGKKLRIFALGNSRLQPKTNPFVYFFFFCAKRKDIKKNKYKNKNNEIKL